MQGTLQSPKTSAQLTTQPNPQKRLFETHAYTCPVNSTWFVDKTLPSRTSLTHLLEDNPFFVRTDDCARKFGSIAALYRVTGTGQRNNRQRSRVLFAFGLKR